MSCTHVVGRRNSAYNSSDVYSTTVQQISERVTMKWVDSFLNRFNFVICRQSGALSRSPSQKSFSERKVSYHLGCLQQRFEANLSDRIWLTIWMRCTSYSARIITKNSAFVEATRLTKPTWLVDAMG